MNGTYETRRHECGNGLLTVVTRRVALRLTPEELHRAYLDLRRKMQTPDPKNPNLWITWIRDEKIWGVFDRCAGPNGEDVLTMLFPSEY